ncbi:MAG: uroporphyrinogen-III synthase, partial [Gammaproteobacteria bacterium]|nr:uroporphyrinogen-III synthase [Gammaproteobacteria bacterium]
MKYMAEPELSLNNLHVLITRPEDQAENICQELESLGAKPIRFPVLEIVDIEDETGLNQIVDELDSYDIAVFISPNAVKKAANRVQSRRGWPESVKIAAVGKASAKALDSLGLIADIFPPKRFNSEALLELPEMRDVKDKKIVIFRGEGGRETLAETLKARGATVKYAECYRRRQPKADVSQLLRHWARGEVNIVVTTSNEGLHNLYDMVGQLGRQWLIKSPLVVLSERAKTLAGQLGFKNQVIVAPQASDEG